MLHIEALAITIFNCQNLRKYNFLEIANFVIFIFRNLHEVIPFRKLQTILNITEQIFFLQKEVDFGGLATIKSEPNHYLSNMRTSIIRVFSKIRYPQLPRIIIEV